MTNAVNSISSLGRRSALRGQAGFSLMEVMTVVVIMSLMASLSWPVVVGLVSGNQLTNNAYELSGLIQQARTTAVTQHTYVWLGFSSYTTPEGNPSVMVATVSGNSGLATDLPGNCRLSASPVILRNVSLTQAQNYAGLPGLDAANNTDAASQASYTFQLNIAGQSNVKFSEVIAFGPDGQVGLMPLMASGNLQPLQCVGVGLNAAPGVANKLHTVAVQVHGLSGQVSVFQQ